MTEPTIDQDLLAKDLKERIDREGLTLAEAGEQIGCSAATLSRLLKGSHAETYPDMTTLMKSVSWLGRTLADYESGRTSAGSTITDVEVHLRALPGLTRKDKEALVAMVRAAHDAALRSRKKTR